MAEDEDDGGDDDDEVAVKKVCGFSCIMMIIIVVLSQSYLLDRFPQDITFLEIFFVKGIMLSVLLFFHLYFPLL
jgi:hypothetical protein